MSVNSTIKYAYFVDNVSRKFTLRKNTCSQLKTVGPYTTEPIRYMGGSVRNTTRFGVGLVQKNVMFLRFNPRTSAVSSDELLTRQAFGAASRGAAAWAKDLSQIASITAAWKDTSNGSANGVHKAGYTLRGWLFAVAFSYAILGESVPAQFPTYVPAA